MSGLPAVFALASNMVRIDATQLECSCPNALSTFLYANFCKLWLSDVFSITALIYWPYQPSLLVSRNRLDTRMFLLSERFYPDCNPLTAYPQSIGPKPSRSSLKAFAQ